MKKQHNRGFTLIEIIVSIALLAIIALFLLPMSMYGIQFSRWNGIKLTAMNLAYSQVEWLRTLDYNDELGLNSIGYSPKGIVEEKLYLNEPGSDPKTIQGIEYKLLTSIYWESAESYNGDFVANAIKKADVTVKARDPISGKEKTYAVTGTLIAFEGERSLTSFIPLKIRVLTGSDFSEGAKNVKVIVNNQSNTMVSWGRTDEKGEVVFTDLANAVYKVFPDSWEEGDMTARPTGKKTNAGKEEWIYEVLLEVGGSADNSIDQTFYVDYPAYIILTGYADTLLNSAYCSLNPIYDPPEGQEADLDLGSSLKDLSSKKIWREWIYEHKISFGEDEYFFVEKDSGNLWNGSFEYKKGAVTKKELKLAYGLKDGNFIKNGDGTITLEVGFTTSVEGIDTMMFSIYQGDDEVDYSDVAITQAVSGQYNKYLINLKTAKNITSDTLSFVIDNKEADTLVNEYGMKLVQDRNYCRLSVK